MWFCLRIVHKHMKAAFSDLIHDPFKGLHRIIIGHIEFIALNSGGDEVFFRFPWQYRCDNSTACHSRVQRSSFAFNATSRDQSSTPVKATDCLQGSYFQYGKVETALPFF